MTRKSKRSKIIQEKVDHQKVYDLIEAINLLKEIKATKFDESVEVSLRLGAVSYTHLTLPTNREV